MSETIRIRHIDGAQILDMMNCAAISERFFHRTRAWFIQRLNNNIINGKPVSFTADELLRLRTSLKVIASEITQFTTQIPNLPTDMSIKVYVLTDSILIDFAQNGDIEGFKEYLDSDDTIYFNEPETFDTEAEALAYCAGVGYGVDERAPVERYILCTCKSEDIPFIEAIDNY